MTRLSLKLNRYTLRLAPASACLLINPALVHNLLVQKDSNEV